MKYDFSRLRDYQDSLLPMLNIPGNTLIISKSNEEIYRYTTGFDDIDAGTPLTDDVYYNVYSISKVTTAVAAAQLLERGEICLSEPLYAYIPEYRDMYIREKTDEGERLVKAKNPITLRQLMTMTAGFDYNLESPSIKAVAEKSGGACPTLDVVRAIAKEPLLFEPGTHYSYSLGLDIMGGVIEVVTGMRLRDYVRENIFQPLGMTRTFYHPTKEINMKLAAQYERGNDGSVRHVDSTCRHRLGEEFDGGGAGLVSVADDQLLLAEALAGMGVGRSGERILSPAAVDLMRTNMLDPVQLAEFRSAPHFYGYGYGMGVRTNMTRAYGNLSPVGEFGWDGAKGALLLADPANDVAFFYVEHVGGSQMVVHNRLRNLIYAALGTP